MRGEIKKLWRELGRDPERLKIGQKNPGELKIILEKLKAIKYSFDLLFSKQEGLELATEVLKSVFRKDEE